MCTPEKRLELLKKDDETLKKEEEILKEKYTIDFNNRNQRIKNNNIEEIKEKNLYLTEKKEEKWYKKIINKILKFFKIK